LSALYIIITAVAIVGKAHSLYDLAL